MDYMAPKTYTDNFDPLAEMLSADFQDRKHLFQKFDELIMKVKYDASNEKLTRHRICADATLVEAKLEAHEKI
jgi:hypothetical protein